MALNPEDARELSEALGQIGKGWWRTLAAYFKMGVPEALGMSRREWAETYHGYMKLAIEERREAVEELAGQGMSQREIADAVGVDQKTVSRDLHSEANASPEPTTAVPAGGRPEADASPEVKPQDLKYFGGGYAETEQEYQQRAQRQSEHSRPLGIKEVVLVYRQPDDWEEFLGLLDRIRASQGMAKSMSNSEVVLWALRFTLLVPQPAQPKLPRPQPG